MIWCPFASTLLVCLCVCVRLTGEELVGCHRPVLHYFTWQWRRHLNGENVTVGQRPGLYSVPGLLTNCSPPKLQLYISTTKTTIKTTLTYDRGFFPDLSIIVCLFCTLCLSWSCTIHTHSTVEGHVMAGLAGQTDCTDDRRPRGPRVLTRVDNQDHQ